MTSPPADDPLLTITEAMTHLNTSRRTIWQRLHDGELTPVRSPAHKPGSGRTYIHLSDLNAYLERRRPIPQENS